MLWCNTTNHTDCQTPLVYSCNAQCNKQHTCERSPLKKGIEFDDKVRATNEQPGIHLSQTGESQSLAHGLRGSSTLCDVDRNPRDRVCRMGFPTCRPQYPPLCCPYCEPHTHASSVYPSFASLLNGIHQNAAHAFAKRDDQYRPSDEEIRAKRTAATSSPSWMDW